VPAASQRPDIRRTHGFDPVRPPGMIADHRSLLRAFGDCDVDRAAAFTADAAKARSDLIATIGAVGSKPTR
jgi:hypothetical protein